MVQLGFKLFLKFADENFVVCFSVVKELRREFCFISYEQCIKKNKKNIDGQGHWSENT